MTTTNPLLTIGDYEARARETMPKALFDRLFGDLGAPDWTTNTNNLTAMDAVKLRPRVLVGGGERDLTTTVLGDEISFPVMLAPTGTHQRAHPLGELAATRAAGAAGTILGLSTCVELQYRRGCRGRHEPAVVPTVFLSGPRAYRNSGAPGGAGRLQGHDADGGQPGRHLPGA